MPRAIVGLLLCLLATPAAVQAAQPPVTYTFSGASIAGAGWLDEGRIWFVAEDFGDRDLPYTGTPCPTGQTCAVWGVIDTGLDAVVELAAAPGMRPVRAERIGDQLYIAARLLAGTPSGAPSALPPPLDATRRLLIVDPEGAIRFDTALPVGLEIHQIVDVGTDLVLAGTAPCQPTCGSVFPGPSSSTRLLRLNRSLSGLRYDRTLPGRWLPVSHAVDDDGRIHFGAYGFDLPISPQSALAWRPILDPVDLLHTGGVVGVDAATGDIAYATYLHIRATAYLQVKWDRSRDSIWILGETRDQRFPLSSGAGDTVFCVAGSCTPPGGCAVFGGQTCNEVQEAALVQLDRDGRSVQHATYVGGPASDVAHALYVAPDGSVTTLSAANRLGVVMGGTGETGPRQLTNVNPETGLHRGPADDASARWTSNTAVLAQDASHGDLFGRRFTTLARPGQAVVHLHPDCISASSNPPVHCFSLVWTPHLGSGALAPQPVPMGRGGSLLLILVLAVAAAFVVRRQAAAEAVPSRS
jgi:hypothetical protein